MLPAQEVPPHMAKVFLSLCVCLIDRLTKDTDNILFIIESPAPGTRVRTEAAHAKIQTEVESYDSGSKQPTGKL